MKRWLPAPLLSLMLGVSWLLLNESASVGHLLLALALALVVPLCTARYRVDPPRLRNGAVLLRLMGRVLVDIVLSNFEVARRVLGPDTGMRSRFVWVPLNLRDPHAIVALAGIVTLTPGTLSSDLSPDRRHLLVHALHCPDDAAEAQLIADIQTRYEAPLREIFE